MQQPPQALIVAPNASEALGGEAFLPLHYFRILSRRGYPVRLIAHARNRQELLELPDIDASRMYFVPDSRWHRLSHHAFRFFPGRIRDLIGGAVMKYIDEYYQSKIIRQLVTDGHVDVIHQPTPVSPLIPSGLHKYGVPLVIGPMNGGMDYPPGYDDHESGLTRHTIALGRRLAVAMNRIKSGKHHATILLVANERTRKALPDPDHPGIETLIENGIDFSRWTSSPQKAPKSGPGALRLVYMGRFLELKAIDITLRAVALARERGIDVTLDLLGDGDIRNSLENLATSLGLQDHVTFHGFQPQGACANILMNSDALVLNSVRECGGAVILEAMAMELPVIASAWGGPLDYVDPSCGMLVDPVPRESFGQRLADAFAALANDPQMRARMGSCGMAIAKEKFDWERKVDSIIDIYRDAVAMYKNSAIQTL